MLDSDGLQGPGPTGGATAAFQPGGFTVPWNEPSRTPLPRHLYVHVPLCRSKCAYCSFYSAADSGAISHAELVSGTLEALAGWLVPEVQRVPLQTLYVGGGTPTVLGQELVALVRGLTELIPLAPGAEVTIEANPESLSPSLLRGLVDAGVTRVSIGVQSLDDDALRLLGRCHDSGEALAAIRTAVAAELDVSVDLIAGVPGVSADAWAGALHAAVDSGASHLSIYPLTIEAGTPMAEAVAEGRMPAPDEDATVDAMEAAARILGERGLVRYEVANYARPGKESRHNTAYWTGWPYLGIGGGAQGMLSGDQARALGLVPAEETDVARVRYGYADEPFPMRAERPLATFETLTAAEALREDAMLGMRMTEGIADELAVLAGVTAPLESLVRDGLVVHGRGRWRPTERGWLFGNEVFGRIWGAVE